MHLMYRFLLLSRRKHLAQEHARASFDRMADLAGIVGTSVMLFVEIIVELLVFYRHIYAAERKSLVFV